MTTPGADHVIEVNYIDKLFAVHQRVDGSANRCIRLQVLLSTLLVGLSTGLVSATEDLEISGIMLKLPLWIVLGGGAVATSVVTMLGISQTQYADRLEREIVDLYSDLGYTSPTKRLSAGVHLTLSVPEGQVSLLEKPNLSMALLAMAMVLSWSAAVLLLPIAAQLAVLIKLGSDFGWTWQVLVPVGGCLLLCCSAMIAFVRTEGTFGLADDTVSSR